MSRERKCVRAASNTWRVGSFPRFMSSLGIDVHVPKSSWAGEDPIVREGVFLQPRRTKGKTRVQLYEMDKIRSEVFSVRWKRSSIPLVC